MKYLMLASRWLVWLMILALESVVGLPWVSLWLFGEWLFLTHNWFEQLVILLIAGVFFATAYGLSLPVAGLVLGLIWLARGGIGFMAGNLIGSGDNRHPNSRFWSVVLLGIVVWRLKREELHVDWVWWSSILSWLWIGFMDGRRILWKKPKLLNK